MSGRRNVIIILTVVMLLGLTLIPSNAKGKDISAPFGGPVLGESNITVLSGGHIEIVISGNVNFDVYFMTDTNFHKAENNESFGYIQDLSAMNVTSVDLQADVPAGTYAIYGVTHGPGMLSGPGDFVLVTYPSNGSSSNSIPWDVIAIIGVTTLVSVLATYAVMRYIKNKA
jgi:hypothetical protein